ncbi:hypothetical protein M378DRAFT_80006 [Amanita muscaria Koide BX008]|uniref:DUF221-domain-containing protein n=1 Tax=Amanita muscaria (strain Koide BX008) TaxID=946122 RepID=A0A0C2WNQ0_AMAMK|nr:hypothetical protein M378DRAFT_80006 [Amanita muscaria Koide BX008]
MGDIQTRPFSKNYRPVLLPFPRFDSPDLNHSGLINQSAIAVGISIICIAGYEVMKRRRRGKHRGHGIGSRESWEFGYLFQGRSWARRVYPSPPSPVGWPLSWINEVARFPESKLNELCGVDATLYTRFLRGCLWFASLHSLTTFPVLFPIHLWFADISVSPESMTKASISSLVGTPRGLSLLWIHILFLFWITITWVITLCWICLGALQLRQAHLLTISERISDVPSLPLHPHPPFTFADTLAPDEGHPNIGLRSRTVMVSNIPRTLRNEVALKGYFTYYMSQKLERPSIGLTSSSQPGLLDKCCAFLLNRLKNRLTPNNAALSHKNAPSYCSEDGSRGGVDSTKVPVIERAIICKRMGVLASEVERREETLAQLEAAHIKLANDILSFVKTAMDNRRHNKLTISSSSLPAESGNHRHDTAKDATCDHHDTDEEHIDHLIAALGPFIRELEPQRPFVRSTFAQSFQQNIRLLHRRSSNNPDLLDKETGPIFGELSDSHEFPSRRTVWEALLSLPRSCLKRHQPRASPYSYADIDILTARLEVLTSNITQHRAKAPEEYDPVSTAFVTFGEPIEARRACMYLAAHPNNPLACIVTMAPAYEDLDWMSVMKPSFINEFIKDWVVSIGIWGFTLFWLFPVSLLVGLVSIQNISRFWPSLKTYLDRHAWQEEIIQSFAPTILVAILTLLIPPILYLIATKAHTIKTLSGLHDLVLVRYYKFLVINVLVLFCVGTAALQSFLLSFKLPSHLNLLQIVADSFPSAGPFYVGWLVFSTAVHGFLELTLVGLPLLTYPSTARETTPRKRAVGIRPPTFPYYYWMPNHLLVLHVLLLFSVLNPFVLPFGALYFLVQFIHVYARSYEGNGHVILIRIVRYSLDGLILAQAVFLSYMVVLRRVTNVGLSAVLVATTLLVKVLLTRICRAQFEIQDIEEAELLKSKKRNEPETGAEIAVNDGSGERGGDAQTGFTLYGRSRPSLIELSSRSLQNWLRTEQRHHTPSKAVHTAFSGLCPANQPADGQHTAVLPQVGLIGTESSLAPHPAPRPWDDQTMIDRPYDNPFYSRPIDNALWLPRNPSAILDLDDTVDLRMPLTENLDVSKLGRFGLQNPSGATTPNEQQDATPRQSTEGPSLLVHHDKARLSEVNSSEARSTKASVEDADASSRQVHTPPTQPRPIDLRVRSLSEGQVPTAQRSTRITSANLAQFYRTRSSDIDKVSSRARTETFGIPSALHYRNISAHDAIFSEVLAEEEQVQLDHLNGERLEENMANAAAKSWLTSWMFKKAVV